MAVVTGLLLIDGWSEIEYPISGGRTKRGYCLSSYLFANPDFSGDTGLVRSNITTYRKANCSVKYGTSTKNDNVFITGYSNGNTQILYKCTGYYKVAWIRGTYSVSNGYLVNGSGTVSAGNLNANKLKSLVTSAGVGAHVRTDGRNHSMVIIGVTNNNFTIVDANSDGKNTIRVKTYTWSEYMNCTYGKRGLLYIKKYVG